MKEPKINLGLVVKDDRTTLMVSRSDGAGIPGWLHWDLHEVERAGFHALCQRVGEAALRMLARAHPDEFARFPQLVPPKLPYEDPRGIASALITLSISEKTTNYAAAIDALLARNAADFGHTDLPETWAHFKRELNEGTM